MEKWEYLMVTLWFDNNTSQWNAGTSKDSAPVGDDLGTALNQWGELGWEAVSMVPMVVALSNSNQTSFLGVYLETEWTAQQFRVLLKRHKP